MAFIRITKNREGNTHVYLVEGYRADGKVKQRIIKKFGLLEELEAKEAGVLERLKKEAKAGLLLEDETIEVTYDLQAPIHTPDKIYGWKILDDVLRTLTIEQVLKKHKASNVMNILRLLVFHRVLLPDSKKATVERQTDFFGNWDVSLNSVYRALDIFDSHKEDIQLHIHQKITELTNRTALLVFYDVTNYYFETDIDDSDTVNDAGERINEGLRRRGASKENRPNPIVQLGLFMDTNGIPISYQLFRGNFTDPLTYLPAIEQVKKQFGINRLIVVADKAMNSQKNIKQTLQDENGWLFSQKHRGKNGAPKDIQKEILDQAGWEFNEQMTFAKKSYVRERLLVKGKKNGMTVKEKVLITWSKKYADREKIRREGALEYASKLTQPELYRQTSKKGGKKYLEVSYHDSKTGETLPYSPLITINQSEVDFDAQFDGVNVLVTSEIEMSDEDILEHYKELSRIEDCFRVSKTELKSRPVYVRTKAHIEGHFLTCFLGLVILRYIGYRIHHEMSAERIVSGLLSAKATPLKGDYYRVQENEDMTALNKLLGIEWNKGIVKYEELNQFAKDYVHNTKQIEKTIYNR